MIDLKGFPKLIEHGECYIKKQGYYYIVTDLMDFSITKYIKSFNSEGNIVLEEACVLGQQMVKIFLDDFTD